ncbi:MAG: Gldg family protein [Verrucomicrobia bacterium]|nr:Gldg family protein [Verrucomicrobiota bacterium]
MIKNRKQLEGLLYSAVGIVVVFVILAAFNIITGAFKQRIDLTDEKLFTLSKGTKAILGKLDTPVKIRFYFSRGESDNPQQLALRNYAQRVEDLLSEYRQYSRGKIEIEKLNPLPDSDAEDSANLDGVTGQMINLTDKLYLGVAVSCLDAKEAIPFLAPERERLLEYDISRAIARVARPEKPVIGVLSALPVNGMPMNPMMMRMGQQGQDPWVFISELKSDFQVKTVETTTEKIEDDIKVLLLIYPKDLPEKAQYAVDQFVLRGGKLIAFLDPLSIADNRNSMQNPLQRASASGATIDKLLKAWGKEFDVNKCIADLNYVSRLNRGGRVETAPAVLSLAGEAINSDDVATSQLDNVLLAYAGAFTGTPAEGLKETVLLKTSKNSQTIDKMMAEFAGENALKDFKPSDKEQALALRLTGKFKSAFPDGKPDAKDDKTEDAEKDEDKKDEKKEDQAADNADHLKESKADGVVVLIGDSDLIFDPVCVQVGNFFGQKIVQQMNGNLPLAQSLVEQLAGDSNLIEVRSRATLNRPFLVVKKMQAEAETAYRSKIKQLEDALQEAQTKVNELAKSKEKGQRFILSKEQQAEIEKFRKQESDTKRQLKDVRKQLRRDIDSLETRFKWLNIAGMPLLVTGGGIALAVIKKKKTAAK